MRAKDRTPSTRLLALFALILATGLLSFRAYDVFRGETSDPVGSATERELTYLLEPITGAQNVRVSIQGYSPKTVLIMINGAPKDDLSDLRPRLEAILIAAIGFAPETDTLTLKQFPFAQGTSGEVTSAQALELIALGALSILLLATLLMPDARPQDPVVADDQPVRRLAPKPRQHAARQSPTEIDAAARLAQSKPNETAALIRGWLMRAED
ncbi:MAG: hypothetical protein AAF767_08250 [Pseudomonadota bacterium]